MSNGTLVSPSAVRVYPVPTPALLKSIRWVFCRDVGSTPCGLVLPLAATEPSARRSCHGTAWVVSVTSVAYFVALGTYPAWFTRTRGPVSGTYGGGAVPPASDTSSKQNV